MASRRLTRYALPAIKASNVLTTCDSRARAISASVSTLRNSFGIAAFYCPPNFDVVARNYGGGILPFYRFQFHIQNSDMTSEFTDTANNGLFGAVKEARDREQLTESEHLMKALLEQKDGLATRILKNAGLLEQRDGLATRILKKAGLDHSLVLQATEDFLSKQPRVMEKSNLPKLWNLKEREITIGSHLASLLYKSLKHKKEMGDQLVSVEHLVLAFMSDKRFGQRLFNNLQISEQALQDAIQACLPACFPSN